jgi:hypothetical protein
MATVRWLLGLRCGRQFCQCRRQVIDLTNNVAAAGADKIFNLQIDDSAFVVSGETEVAPVAQNGLVLRKAVADLGCGAAVDICSIKHSENHVTFVDQALVLTPNLGIDPLPGITALCPEWQLQHRGNISRISPRVQKLMTEFLQYRDDAVLVKSAPCL